MCVFILTGCWDRKIFERIGFVLEVGFDKGVRRDLLITSVIPVIDANKKGGTDLLIVDASSMMQAIDTNNRLSSKLLLGGKIQQLLFSDEIAEKGIINLMNVMSREPENSLLAYVAVVDGSTKDLMKAELQFKNKPRPGIYVNQLIKAAVEHSYIPNTRIYDFHIDYFTPGKDPVAPLLKLRRDGIEAMGSALFSGDKMVGKMGIRETMMLIAMQNKQIQDLRAHFENIDKAGSEGNGEHTLTAALKVKKRKIKVVIKNNKPVVNIYIDFSAVIDEYKWDKSDDPIGKKKIEEIINNEVKGSSYQTLKYMQKVGSDPIGIGEIVRSKYNSYWKSVDWKKAYKNAEMHFDSNVTIKDIGDIK